MTPINQFPPPKSPAPMVQTSRAVLTRDILWGQPIFKAPNLPLPNPKAQFEQLPFTATRITRPDTRARATV